MAYIFDMNFKDSLPLYPPEAYSEQNNPSAFMRSEGQNEQMQKNGSLSGNPMLPLLVKMLMGGQSAQTLSQDALSALANGSQDQINPLLSVLSSMTNSASSSKKNSSEPSGPKEKPFPDD